MEVIIDAKERQAAEANKNATILLQEIDLEKVHSTVSGNDHIALDRGCAD